VAQLAAWLQANRDEEATWDLATASAQNASTLIAQYDLSVLAIGGFSGRDATITAAQFAEMVADGKVRYVLTLSGAPGGGPAPAAGARDGVNNLPGTLQNAPAIPGATATGSTAAGANAVFAAVQAVCAPVTGSGAPAQYQGALYDCAGKAVALARR
jgi:hypothetical protein